MQVLAHAFRRCRELVLDHRRRQRLRTRKKQSRLTSPEVLEIRMLLTTYTVNSLGDNNVGTGNTGDLRYVINRANELNTGTPSTPDVIQFSGVTLTPGNHTIFVGGGAAGAVPLPALTAVATVDGTTAGGVDNLAGLMLTLDGRHLGGEANGLTLEGGNAIIMALEIVNFPGNGILIHSSNNVIGGDEVGYDANNQRNNPTGRITTLPRPDPATTSPVYVRPPQGNVISGNGRHGVLVENGANNNLFQGNFIGTDISGTKARGNGGDGVVIKNSDNNKLYGTTPPDQDNPFVFYNVISGNKGNGLVVDDSDSTIIYANFFGLGADNRTPVGNRLNGVLIKGNSDGTRFGLNIPLGNVASANGLNGVEVRDTASRTLLMNTFGGIAAFNPSAQVGNQGNGILITTNGGGKYFGSSEFSTIILTSQLSGNHLNGVEISGNAAAVQVSQSVIGMQTNGATAQPNLKNGIEISGRASNIALGGFEPSVLGGSEFPEGEEPFFEAANLISGNRWNGISISQHVSNVTIINSFIGTDISGSNPAGNGRNGIYIVGSSGNQIGSPLNGPTPGNGVTHLDRNIIAFNAHDGVQVNRATGNSIIGNSIYQNGRLGIHLIGCGIWNPPAPRLVSAQIASNGTTQVRGTLIGRPRTTYLVEVFADPSAKPGNGKISLGTTQVTTDARGHAQFKITGLVDPQPRAAGFISATVTGPTGTTSMFSRPIRAQRIG